MEKRSDALRHALTKPPETFSSWALTAVLLVVAVGLVGWFFDDFRTAMIIGAAGMFGAAVGARSRARKRHPRTHP